MKKLNEILQVKQQAEATFLHQPGVTAVDVGYKYKDGKRTDEIAIRVHVAKKKTDVPAKEKVPKTIEGIPTDVIEGIYYPQVLSEPVADSAITAFADTGTYTPLKGGISIGPDRVISGYVYTGTLGAIVKDATTNETLLLSNFHVMCVDTGWHVGDQMDQPSRVDGGTSASNVGALKRAVLSGHVDGAVSTVSGRSTLCEIVDIGKVKGTATAVLNAPVRKRGRTTLLTYGFVDAISATINVDYGDGIGVRTLSNQIGIRPDTSRNPKFSDHGDSGSVVVDAANKVIGLLFAGDSSGYTFINPISYVLTELNIKLCTSSLKSVIKDKGESKELKEVKEIKEVKEKDKKEIVKEVKEKEKVEKAEVKEIKEIKEKELKEKELKEKKEIFKEIKDKDLKEVKEFKEIEHKPVMDKSPKELAEIPGGGNPRENPAAHGAGSGLLEQRLANIEAALQQLSSFIASAYRPDLSQGGLSGEEDVNQDDLEKSAADSSQLKWEADNNY
ncbi:hypothetical protein ECE50_008120 [Chitinophaga sp. Mgbs1]|uniref:Uncharacterized protein n=1 Tax=Chitinophaga solisilvae TaxID=1233460 RepID=A0A3S1JFF5_9BACT|nr:hypothetical protein [Chitinophaga solisilvae]